MQMEIKMPVVKCIKIDSKNKNLKYLDVDIPIAEERSFLPKGFKEGIGLGGSLKYTLGQSIFVYHWDATVDDPKKIPNYGCWLQTQALFTEFVQEYRGPFKRIYGDALIVVYEKSKNEEKYGQLVNRAYPIDSTLSLEEASRLVGKYTNGVEDHIPDFTCLVTESFAQRGFEISLRIENEEIFPSGLDRPIRNLTPQILTFTFCKQEITIITGKISNMGDKVQVSIFESGRADLRCIASCTLAANKIAGWVKGRLTDYYFNLLVAEPFFEDLAKKRSSEVKGQELGID